MIIENVNDYLCKHNIKKINVGQSGADVYVVDNTYILKCARKDTIQDEDIWASYLREARFYEAIDRSILTCIPNLEYLNYTSNEIILLMKKYRMVRHNEINREMLAKIMKTIVKVHNHPLPEFLKGSNSELKLMSSEQINDCVNGWLEVLSEHKDIFPTQPLTRIAENMNEIITFHHLSERKLVHGDFHCDNLLMDVEGNICICDWQSVSNGCPSGDLSFFISRLSSDHVYISEQDIISIYCECYNTENGIFIDCNSIKQHMSASNLITSFRFWHEYLHNSDVNRVRVIYDKMIENLFDFDKR
ncbi:MAG: Ecdysteroid kinase [Herbinix sp.]|nr:Ecdysteroid kinase [Herbinix sp.]